MFFIKQLLSETDLLDGQSAVHSIACISTSRPIYLVFDQESDYPIYVIRKLDEISGLNSQKIHGRLYRLAGNLVPEPIGVYEHAGEIYDIQRGVRGAPWFQLKSKVRTEEASIYLGNRMWATLRNFQTTICPANANEARNLKPHEELHKAYSAYRDNGNTPSANLAKIVDEAFNDLSSEPDTPAVPQHGDFCLNNLIIDTDHITVIDFEDFSITNMPLYDHFTLALSLPSCGDEPVNAANVFNLSAIVDAGQSLGIPEKVIRWHFLHHLLLRLGPWSTGEKRKIYRAWLKKVLICFLAKQEKEPRT
jgi:aminoglycoside phosphotransferase